MRWPLLLLLGLAGAGCGGLVVLELDDEPAGDGGRGGSGGEPIAGYFSPPADVVTTGTGSDQCADLLAAFSTAVDHAQACSPLDPNIQCDASVVLLDLCACPTFVVNENLVGEIAEAQAAYDAWVAAGCGPYRCESCTPAISGFCETMGDPGKGRCNAGPP